jgi:hypothetical protein
MTRSSERRRTSWALLAAGALFFSSWPGRVGGAPLGSADGGFDRYHVAKHLRAKKFSHSAKSNQKAEKADFIPFRVQPAFWLAIYYPPFFFTIFDTEEPIS